MSVKVALPSGVLSAARSIPASTNAWSVGANTVNGPSPSRVGSNSAWITAATSELWTPVQAAVLGTSVGVEVGVRTLSITWIIPLLVATSGVTTVASLTITLPTATVNDNGKSLTAVADIQSVRALDATAPGTT